MCVTVLQGCYLIYYYNIILSTNYSFVTSFHVSCRGVIFCIYSFHMYIYSCQVRAHSTEQQQCCVFWFGVSILFCSTQWRSNPHFRHVRVGARTDCLRRIASCSAITVVTFVVFAELSQGLDSVIFPRGFGCCSIGSMVCAKKVRCNSTHHVGTPIAVLWHSAFDGVHEIVLVLDLVAYYTCQLERYY